MVLFKSYIQISSRDLTSISLIVSSGPCPFLSTVCKFSLLTAQRGSEDDVFVVNQGHFLSEDDSCV